MTTSLNKLAGPARRGEWGLTVDSLTRPSSFSVLRYADHSKHTRSFVEVLTLPYQEPDLELATHLAEETEMPTGVARQLVMALASKLASPRVALADPRP